MNLEELIDAFENNPTDRTQDIIRANRSSGDVVLDGGVSVRGSKSPDIHVKGVATLLRAKETVEPEVKKDWDDLGVLLYEWYHYFDTGYQAPHTIDELPDLILEKARLIQGKGN